MRYNELWRILHDSGYAEGEAKAVTRMLLTDKYGMTTADMLCEDVERYTDAETLSADVSALFAGGELSEEAKDAVMRALQDAYWMAKERNTAKYTPKKYRKDIDTTE